MFAWTDKIIKQEKVWIFIMLKAWKRPPSDFKHSHSAKNIDKLNIQEKYSKTMKLSGLCCRSKECKDLILLLSIIGVYLNIAKSKEQRKVIRGIPNKVRSYLMLER